jgi:hypothetical protein
MRRQFTSIECLLNFICQAAWLNAALLSQDMLKASAAQSCACFGAIRNDEARFDIINGKFLGNINRGRRPQCGFGPHHKASGNILALSSSVLISQKYIKSITSWALIAIKPPVSVGVITQFNEATLWVEVCSAMITFHNV